MTRVALYARVSTDDQDCTRQFMDLEAWAERQGLTVVERYEDTGSGTKTDRWSRLAVMRDARLRRIDAVLVTEASRWSRSTFDLLKTLDELAAYGVSLRAMSGLDMDVTTPTGRLMATILAGVAEFERALLIERTKSGQAAARKRGKIIGRPLGSNIVTDKYAKRVLEMRSAKKSYREIAATLKISTGSVQKILRVEKEKSDR